jgi:hypothetical protein
MQITQIMKYRTILLVVLAVLPVSTRAATAENVADAIELVRSTYKADRQAFLADTLQLTESESAAFWPLYRSYRADMDKLGDGLVKLVLEYAALYPNVPDDRARQLLNNYTTLEEKLTRTRASYFKRAGKALSATKALRWAQLENRMESVLRLQLASSIPLLPASQSKP